MNESEIILQVTLCSQLSPRTGPSEQFVCCCHSVTESSHHFLFVFVFLLFICLLWFNFFFVAASLKQTLAFQLQRLFYKRIWTKIMPFSQTASQQESGTLVERAGRLSSSKTWKWNMFTNRCHVVYDQFLPCKNHLVQLEWFSVLCGETKIEISSLIQLWGWVSVTWIQVHLRYLP